MLMFMLMRNIMLMLMPLTPCTHSSHPCTHSSHTHITLTYTRTHTTYAHDTTYCDITHIIYITANDDIVGYAGEGKPKSYGSVVVCVIDGQSYYDRVVRFFFSVCSTYKGMFAYVERFGKPEYPFKGTPLIVWVRDNAPACPTPKVIVILSN
jgi:hypothetical protein